MRRKKQSNLPIWRVVRIKGTPASVIGEVRAKDATSAIKEAIRKFDITDPMQQARLAAHRVG